MSAAVSRVASAGAVVAAFMRRDVTTVLSYRLPFALDVFSSAFQIVLFFYLGRIVDGAGVGRGATFVDGYFPFVLVGLVMLRIVDTALRSFADKLRGEQAMGTFEVLVTTPTSLVTLVMGSAGYNLLYGIASGMITLLIAGGFGFAFDVSLCSALVATAGFVASIGFFMAVGVAMAAFIVVFKQGSAMLAMATQLLGLSGGAYFPVDTFLDAVEFVAHANPLTWSLDVLRAALLTDTAFWSELALLTVAATTLLPASLALLSRAIDRARTT